MRHIKQLTNKGLDTSIRLREAGFRPGRTTDAGEYWNKRTRGSCITVLLSADGKIDGIDPDRWIRAKESFDARIYFQHYMR